MKYFFLLSVLYFSVACATQTVLDGRECVRVKNHGVETFVDKEELSEAVEVFYKCVKHARN